MENVIVIYESKYGTTERYANWISEELGAKCVKRKDFNLNKLSNFDTIIYGGWLCASGIKGFKTISHEIKKLKDKKIIVYSVGCSSPKKEATDGIEKMNFEGIDNINYFYLRGGFNYSKLGLGDKILMNMLKIKLKSIKEEDRDEDTKGMLDAYTNPIDFTDKSNIIPLIDSIKLTV